MKFLIFFLLLSPLTYALDGQLATSYQSYVVDSQSQGGDLTINYYEKLNYNAQATLRTRYGHSEYLLGLTKTSELSELFYFNYGGAVSFETSSFEKFSLTTGFDYYKIKPFHFFSNLTYKNFSSLNFTLINLGMGWESKIGLLFIPQFYIGFIEENSGDSETTLSYALKIIYLNTKLRPFVSYSTGTEADVLLEGDGLTAYKVTTYGVGFEFPLTENLSLVYSFNRIELLDFDKKIDFSQLSFSRNW